MSRRTLAYIGVALAVLVGGRLLTTASRSGPVAPPAAVTTVAAPPDAAPAPATPPLRRPPSSLMELGVLTDRAPEELAPRLERGALAAAIPARLCGDEAACEAVRAALRDEHTTTLEVVASADWRLERLDVDAAGRGLTARERATLRSRARVVAVHVNTPTTHRQIALRAALAAAAVIAEQTDGLVWDQLLDRVEHPAEAAAHAVTTALGGPTFRADRVQLLYQPRGPGVVRVLTGGLSRWGAADVEAPEVPVAAAERVGALLLGVAGALAEGASSGPVLLTRDDLARARGADFPGDAGLPEVTLVPVALASVHPEPGDPNDFMARIVPPAGAGPLAMVELAERFFGPMLAAAPEALATRKAEAQARLPAALAAWSAGRASGARLLALLPFPIPGGGVESMWIEITGADARTVQGTLRDEPLGATDVRQGDAVTRPRTEVEDLEARPGGDR